ncbi:MAG: hypothetical protein P8Y95_04545 [Gammaproteobacteria bacterium]|jgi:DNA-binding NtrC family response regulator
MSKINPDVRVLVSSGYGNVDQTSASLRRGSNALIRKPYTVEELTHDVRQLLDTEPAQS